LIMEPLLWHEANGMGVVRGAEESAML